METTDKLRGFIVDELNWEGSAEELTDDYNLIDNKVVDSLAVFQIVNFLEDEFDIEVPDDELTPENFATVADIARLVESRVGAA